MRSWSGVDGLASHPAGIRSQSAIAPVTSPRVGDRGIRSSSRLPAPLGGEDGPMAPVHPATACVADPTCPPWRRCWAKPPGPVAAVAEATGGVVTDCHPVTVTWWPGASITVRYSVAVEGGELAGCHDLVAAGGRIPDGALIVEADGTPVGVWRVPFDPALPGLAPALDDTHAARLLADLGSPAAKVTTRLRGYRPGRRAVVSVRGEREGIYVKVLRPERIQRLHQRHELLAAVLPVPASLGCSSELGLMALRALPGRTLRDVLEDPAGQLPAPEEVAALVADLPSARRPAHGLHHRAGPGLRRPAQTGGAVGGRGGRPVRRRAGGGRRRRPRPGPRRLLRSPDPHRGGPRGRFPRCRHVRPGAARRRPGSHAGASRLVGDDVDSTCQGPLTPRSSWRSGTVSTTRDIRRRAAAALFTLASGLSGSRPPIGRARPPLARPGSVLAGRARAR